MAYIIVGIDVSTESKKRFISFATLSDKIVSLQWIADGSAQPRLVDDLSRALVRGDKVLLALDAPLGWPVPLAQALANHSAGSNLNYPPDIMFRRSTDRFIRQALNKQSLDVGADRIARTAHAALSFLNEICTSTQSSIPLAWDTSIEKIAAIEVYPAATLIAHGRKASGYKDKDGLTARASILAWLTKTIKVSAELNEQLASNDNALDSALCVLAGRDFLLGDCYYPTDSALAKREGWIWVHNKM